MNPPNDGSDFAARVGAYTPEKLGGVTTEDTKISIDLDSFIILVSILILKRKMNERTRMSSEN